MTDAPSRQHPKRAWVETPLARQLGSLAMAVVMLVVIGLVLAWGTLYETRYGTAAVQRFVYRAWWFQGLLAFLAVNLTVSALTRWPWQRRHAPFLCAHLGIILILLGGILGGRFGVDGQLIIPEGQANKILQQSTNVLVVEQANPGVTQVFPTNFETTAWIQRPHRLFRMPVDGRTVNLVVDTYYPDAELDEQITDDGTEEAPAVQLALRQGEQQERVWLLARDSERFGLRWGELHVFFLEPNGPAAWTQLIGYPPAEASSRGTVTIDLPHLEVRREIPVPDDFSHPVPIEGTPYVVTFKDYFSDLAITEQGVVNRSEEPNNPAIALTLSGPEGADAHLAFALHPEFASMHERQHAIHAQVTYTHAVSRSLPPHAFGVVRHPSGALSCVVTDAAGTPEIGACDIGQPYHVPDLGYEVLLQHLASHARVQTSYRSRGEEIKAEALHITATDGAAVAQAWVGLRQTAELSLGAHPLRVSYRPDERELPVTIKLLDFRKTEYPGTAMAAAFEADVQMTDPQRGLILMRTIKMNTPLRHRGYSFYQSSYIPGEVETTVLSVRNDPGTPFVYAGFLIVMLGVILLFVLGRPQEPSR